MDTNLNTISLPEFTSLVEIQWQQAGGNYILPTASKLFQIDDVGLNSGEHRLYQEFDEDTFSSWKPQGQNTAKGRAGVGYEKQATVRRFGKEIDITEEMRKFNKYPEVINKLHSLIHYPQQRLELDLTHRITFSNATSYTDMDGVTKDITVGDGLALASATHLLKFSPLTYSNLVSGNPAFSRSGLESAELIASTQVVNNFGEKRVKNFNTIFSADNPAVENAVRELLNSTASVEDEKNSGVVNVYKAKYDYVKLPYLASTATGAYDSTKKGWWGIVATGTKGNFASGVWQAYLAIWERPFLKSPSSTNNLQDDHADIWTYGVRDSHDTAIVSGQGFIISMA